MRTDVDLAIVGSGFGGTLLAMIVRRMGLSVALVERGMHPRFAIGESTSPLMNLLIEQLAERYHLPRLPPLATYGTWKRAYPDVVCGLKRGFTYFEQQAGQPYQADTERTNQLLVAASPHDQLADTHWLREDVDNFLLNEAIDLGADYLDRTLLANIAATETGSTLTGTRLGTPIQISARFVVDATGPRGFLSRALNLPESEFAGYPPTQTLFSHFTNVRRCETMPAYATELDPKSEIQNPKSPPYAMDAAALHHVFEGGWMWVLRFDNGVTSAGCAVQDWLAKELNLVEGEPAWTRFLNRFPTVAAQFEAAEAVQPFVFSPRLPYRSSQVVGEGWALLPSAAGFVDPLFSTGMPLTLLGIERLGKLFAEHWGTKGLQTGLREYETITFQELDWTARFIGGCYVAMPQFDLFSTFSMFYFAAASFSEMTRRLGPPLVRRYLAADHPEFAAGLTRCAQRLKSRPTPWSPAEVRDFEREVRDAVACLNVAGLCDPDKRNWYDVDLEDVIANADKLGCTPQEMRRIVETAPWAQIPVPVAHYNVEK